MGDTESEPDISEVLKLVVVQEVAFDAPQVSVAELPAVIVVGETPIVTRGASVEVVGACVVVLGVSVLVVTGVFVWVGVVVTEVEPVSLRPKSAAVRVKGTN